METICCVENSIGENVVDYMDTKERHRYPFPSLSDLDGGIVDSFEDEEERGDDGGSDCANHDHHPHRLLLCPIFLNHLEREKLEKKVRKNWKRKTLERERNKESEEGKVGKREKCYY